MLLDSLLLLAFLFSVFATFYVTFLALVGLLSLRHETAPAATPPKTSFIVLVPAHNEEASLSSTLISCQALDYPYSLFTTIVVADNCTDDTIGVARRHETRCMQRTDPVRLGKGFALEWAIQSLLGENFDALVILDADCVLDRDALLVFDQRLRRGARVLQSNNIGLNPKENEVSYVLAVGNQTENRLLWAPKSKLGLAVFLRGTGMVLHREVLEHTRWKAHGLAEDVEFSLRLFSQNLKVHFVPEVSVASRFPTGRGQLSVQRSRWAGGILALWKRYAFRTLYLGLRRRNVRLIDAAWTLFIQSRPLVLLQVGTLQVLAWLHFFLDPGTFARNVLLASIVVFFLQILYLVLGILLVGLDRRSLALLLRSPLSLARLTLITLAAGVRFRRGVWARTPRA